MERPRKPDVPRQRVASPHASGHEGNTARQPEGNMPKTPTLMQRIFGEQSSLIAEDNRGAIVGLAAVTVVAGIWARLITRVAPEPYLDEVFHIPQAQRYCDYKYFEWDDKITTPPGLYLMSLPYLKAYGCGVLRLRGFNSLALACLGKLALLSRRILIPLLSQPRGQRWSSIRDDSYAAHTAINIVLCPVIFFFSGLYYTDVASTAVVLLSLKHSLDRMNEDKLSWKSDLKTIIWGVCALLMRQTNVFWVVVCFGAWEAVHAVKAAKAPQAEQMKDPGSEGVAATIKRHLEGYSEGSVHDPPLDSTWPHDMLFAAISLLIAAACNPAKVLRQIWPHLTVLGLFITFVVWNGGVVLGDKSNHVATIHLAQMLYIWPLITFFSFPLLIPQALKPLISAYLAFQTPRNGVRTTSPSWTKHLSSAIFLVITTALSLAIVKYNTIIHPFTLADNRHYMFYIFRYTIRRGGWIPVLLVVPYMVCRWLAWGALSGSSAADEQRKQNPKRDCAQSHPVAASTALIWLLATALSLITAPLVEPRYFIIPWVIWRLMVPSWDVPPALTRRLGDDHAVSKGLSIVKKYNLLLWLETIWFVFVNAVTMYVFLMKPYQWRAEDGTLLDEGRLQRFMW